MSEAAHQKLLTASTFFKGIILSISSDENGVPAQTVIACAARMAGTMLFRHFVSPRCNAPTGTVVLSEEASVEGPILVELVLSTIRQLSGDNADIASSSDPLTTTSESRFSLIQTQEYLDPLYLSYCRATALSYREAAHASAIATGTLVHDSFSALGTQEATAIALYGIVEGSKTAPRKISDDDFSHKHLSNYANRNRPRRPWYQFW